MPTNGTVNIGNVGKPSGGVTYTLNILEGYDRIIQKNINAESSVADGGSCGVQLTLGTPQFISAYKYNADSYALSSCTPQLPYDAIRLYLETGEDSFIPEWLKCHSWPEDRFNHTPIFNKELEGCAVWKGADYIDGYYGAAERRKYLKIWWEKIESTESKKKLR